MKTRIIHTKIWKDSWFRKLKPTEKLLFIYYLTNEYVNIIHFYECPDDVASFDTGISIKEITAIKEKFHQDGKILFYKDYVFLVNASKYETYKGEKNENAKNILLAQLSKDVLDWYNNILDRGIDRGIKGVYIPPINHKSEIINNNKEREIIRERENKQEKKPANKGGLDRTSLTREELWQIAMKTKIDLNDVMRKYYAILDMIEEGEFQRRYPKHKSLKLTLMNWLRMDVNRGYLKEAGELDLILNSKRNPKGDWGQDFFSRWEKARKEGRV